MKLGTARARYAALESDRRPFLARGQEAAKLTIPSLLPPDGHTAASDLPTPYQGLGARGLRNISSRLLLALFPPNAPFFQFRVDEQLADAASGSKGAAEVDETLVKMERMVQAEMEVRHVRIAAEEGLQHLALCGNVLKYLPKEGIPRVFPLSQYVVERDGEDNLLEVVIKENVALTMLKPKDQQAVLKAGSGQGGGDPTEEQKTKSVCVYTHIFKSGRKFTTYQEANGVILSGSKGSYRPRTLPWRALRFHRVAGEAYGRGLVEEYLGDLKSMEALSRSMVEMGAAASKILFMVRPGAYTTPRALSRKPNGAFIVGAEGDVSTLQADKFNDLRTVDAVMNRLETRLEHAFLLNSAFQRSGERVTAEEIRRMGEDLEMALGGAYSILALEMQLPIVEIMVDHLKSSGKFPALDDDTIRPSIVTGLEALGRGSDFHRITSFLQTAASTVGPEALQTYVDAGAVLKNLANASGLDGASLMKDPEVVAQEQQQAQMQAMVDRLGPEAIKQLGQQNQAPA